MLNTLIFGISRAAEGALKLASAALQWLLEEPLRLVALVFAVAWGWAYFGTVPRLEADLVRANDRAAAALAEREETLDAFEQTVANTLAAAEAAQDAAEANVARVEAEQSAIDKETIDDLESRLAAARARADELRRAALRYASRDPGDPVAVDLPGPGAAARATAEAPGEAGLPEPGFAPALICITIEEALIATEQAIQLDALIEWNLRQAAVPFNERPAP